MSMMLEFFYAVIDIETGCCGGVVTTSYEVNHPSYVLVSSLNDDYYGKYYKDGFWYEDSEFTVLAEGLN